MSGARMPTLTEKLRLWAGEQVARELGRAATGVPAPGEAEFDGLRVLALASDDALGLSTDPRVREAAQVALRRFGVQGPQPMRPRLELEERLATFFGAEAAVVAGSATPLLAALGAEAGRVVAEAHVAPGLRRALEALADAPLFYDDLGLEQVLEGADAPLVVAPGLRPLSGDLAPLPRYAEISARLGAALLVDETLSAGVLGAHGQGAYEHLGLKPQGLLLLVGLSGALASRGAALVGARAAVDFVRAALDPADVPGPPQVAATTRALELLQAEPQRRERLFAAAERLHQGLRAAGLDTGPAVAHRVPVWVGDEVRCLRLASALLESGVLVRTHTHRDASRLLLTPQATHSDAQLDQAVETLTKLARRFEVPLGRSAAQEPLQLARAGTFAVSAPAGAHWTARPAEPSARPRTGLRALSGVPPRELAQKLFESMETLTWRATNLKAPRIRELLNNPTLRELMSARKSRR